jgi:hypothetical protein
MMGKLYNKLFRPALVAIGLFMMLSIAPQVAASPFGQGKFGANVPFGSATSLTINLGSNVNITTSPSGSTFVGNGSHTITVTSTDVEGYSLYIYGAGGTSMVSSASSIPASSNSSLAPLATNTWGYNIDGSSNFLGLTSTPVLLKTATGPYYDAPDTTTVTYGLVTDITKAAGNYTATVTYTAVALNQ